jgi:hypothetical protein
MRYRWPEDTVFTDVVLNVEQEVCSCCQRRLHVCDHRFHPIHSLQGPLRLVCKLAHCPNPGCPAHHFTLSPLAETQLTLPYWLLGWDVFCWMGFRRFSRHWSIPQLQAELLDSHHIRLSQDAIAGNLQRYRCMVAARHQDAALLAEHYKDIDSLVLTIDGLQPEKGHETLYVVRELRGKRVWFAEALLSSAADEVRRLIVKAKDWAAQLGKPVELWMSDKQDAFLSGIAAEFPDVPHRYCQNHFLRELAKPLLKADSEAKIKMRKKVRGLRDIERQVLEDRREAQARAKDQATSPDGASPAATRELLAGPTPLSEPGGTESPQAVVAEQTAANTTTGGPADGNTAGDGATEAASRQAAREPAAASSASRGESDGDEAGQVVLDYCAAVRGILNDDQGGPLRPPGLRMAEALQEVRESLQRNLEAKKGGAERSSCASSRAASTAACRKSPGNKSRCGSTSRR